MNVRSATLRRVLIGLGFVIGVNLLVLALTLRDGLHDVQAVFSDSLMQQAAGKLGIGSIAIAAIDDTSLKAYGRLENWDRRHYADLIRNLKKAGARAVAFDVAFLDPAQGDDDLAAAIDEAMRPKDGSTPMPVIMAVVGNGLPNMVAGKGLEFVSFQPMAPDVAKGQPILAAVNVDLDGLYVRNLPLVYFSGAQVYEPLPLIAASKFAARQSGLNGNFVLEEQPYRLGFGCELGSGSTAEAKCAYQVPTDEFFRIPIYFFTRPDGYAPNAASLAKIADGQANAETFRDRLVFVGAYEATNLADNYPVPTSGDGKMDGVEIWANAAQSVIEGKFITPQPLWTAMAFMFGASLLAAVFLLWFGAIGWLATLVLALGYTLIRYAVTLAQLSAPSAIGRPQIIEMPNVAPVDVGLVLSSAALFVFLFIQEQRRKSAVYSTFGRYVTPAVAQELASRQASGDLNLGGTRRVATIMFGNLYPPHGVPAEEMLRLLNSYWDGIVSIVNDHNGTVNKFIGDHIMVMFNVPLDLEDHAAAACRAAFEAVEWVKETRTSLPGQEATFGVGVNSGPLVAGNMGSKHRMEYTVLGDTVNTASRLSGVAKDDEVIVSQATVELLDGSGAKLEDRGEVRVKGKAEPVKIYAVLGFGDEGPVQIIQPPAMPAAS